MMLLRVIPLTRNGLDKRRWMGFHFLFLKNMRARCVPAMVSVLTASAFPYKLLDAPKEGLDIEGLFVNRTTGERART